MTDTQLLNLTEDEILERFAKHVALIDRIQKLINQYERDASQANWKYANAADQVVNGNDESLNNRIDAAQYSQMAADYEDFVLDLQNVLDPPDESGEESVTVDVEVAA